MDRERLIDELTSRGIAHRDDHLKVVEELGRGGNGVALLCSGATTGEVVAKVYIPPDRRDLDDQSVERFRNEVKLASTIKHPNVIPAIGDGTASIGAYTLPYYLMPQAASTLRASVGVVGSPEDVEKLAVLLMQTCFGVSCLHSHGLVHRDLKPENILISREGTAWVADLGIAHIDPDFVSVGLRTIAAEKLLNRDYYAPEQRFGTHSEVDARADIYALGCILYESFAGFPPVRRDSPKLQSINPAFAALDPVVDRMTSYEPGARYSNVESAAVDLALALGWIRATMQGARAPTSKDLSEVVRLLRSNNGAKRAEGVILAVGLGAETLPDLHELMGHGRRDVRNAAATALGQIQDRASLPFLVAGLQGNSKKRSGFRPAVDNAADALAGYDIPTRQALLVELSEPIVSEQLLTLLRGFDTDDAFSVVSDLQARKLLLLDWSETVLEILLAIDPSAAWPRVKRELSSLSGWTIARLIRELPSDKQLEVARDWMRRGRGDSWDWDSMGRAISQIDEADADLRPVLEELYGRLDDYPGQARRRDELVQLVARRLEELES